MKVGDKLYCIKTEKYRRFVKGNYYVINDIIDDDEDENLHAFRLKRVMIAFYINPDVSTRKNYIAWCDYLVTESDLRKLKLETIKKIC